jgi:hypothetical protein
VDRYNVNVVFAAGYALWSLATGVTVSPRRSHALVVLRLLLGAGEAVAYPSYSKIIANTFAEHQRGLANALIDAGTKLGPPWARSSAADRLAHRLACAVLDRRIPQPGVDRSVAPRGASGARPRQRAATQPSDSRDHRQARRLGNVPRPVLHQLRLVFPAHLDALLAVKERGFTMDRMAVFGSIPYLAAALGSTFWAGFRIT